MANAGRILIIPKGAWSADQTYEMLDLVNHGGTSWLAKKTSAGIAPSIETSEYWFNFMGITTKEVQIANNLTTIDEGLVLDATQGKVLMDVLEQTNTKVSSIESQLAEAKLTLSGTSTALSEVEADLVTVEESVETMQSNATIIRGTLAVGAISIVLTDARITTNSMMSFYTSVWGVNPKTVTVVSGQVTLTFDAQTVAVEVGVRIDG